MEKGRGSVLYGFYGNLLTDRQKDIFESYYLYDNSLGEIAERLSIARQSVRGTLVKAERILLGAEDKLGFSALTYEVIASLTELKAEVSEQALAKLDAVIRRLEE